MKKLAAVAATAFAALQIGQFLKGSIDAASDLNESVSKVGVVFGQSAGEIQDWAKTAAKSLGQSQQQALEAAGTFGNLFVALKIGAPQAATMSKAMVGLAGDLASFNNVSPDEALEALRSGLVGETEPLRKFGVNLNDATLKAKAMELGLSDGKATLDANAKAQAAYALILEQTGTAQGDFARTSGGLANQQRIIAAQFIDLKASIGDAFQPAAVAVAQVLSTRLLPALDALVDTIGPKVAGAVAGFVQLMSVEIPQSIDAFTKSFQGIGDEVDRSGLSDKFATLGEKLKVVVDLVKDNPEIFKPLIAAVGGMAAALATAAAASGGLGLFAAGLNGVFELLPLLLTPVGLFALAVAGLAAAAVIAYQNIEPFRKAVDRVKEAFSTGGFKAAVDQAGVEFGRLWDVVKPKLEEFIAAAGAWITAHAPGILEGLKTAWVGFATFMGTEFFPFLITQLGVLLSQLGGWIVDVAGPAIKEKLVTWGQAFGNWVSETAWPWLRDQLPVVLGNLAAWIRDTALPAIEETLLEWAKAFSDWVAESAVPWLAENLPLILAAIQEWMVGTVIPQLGIFARNMAIELVKFAAETAVRMPGELALVTGQLVAWVTGLMAQIPAMMVSLGWAIIQGLASGIWNALGLLSSAGTNIRNTITNALGDVGGLLYGAGQDLIRGLINGIKSMAGVVADAAKNVVQGAVNAAKSVLGIGSPSKVFMGFGVNVGEGFVLGVEQTGGAVAGAVSSLLGVGPQRFSTASNTATLSPAPAVAGGSAPVVNIYAPLGVDRREVVAAVQQGLRGYDSARRKAG